NRYIVEFFQLVPELGRLRQCLLKPLVGPAQRLPQLPRPIRQAADNSRQMPKQVAQRLRRLSVDNLTGLQTTDYGLDELGDKTGIDLRLRHDGVATSCRQHGDGL